MAIIFKLFKTKTVYPSNLEKVFSGKMGRMSRVGAFIDPQQKTGVLKTADI